MYVTDDELKDTIQAILSKNELKRMTNVMDELIDKVSELMKDGKRRDFLDVAREINEPITADAYDALQALYYRGDLSLITTKKSHKTEIVYEWVK